MRHRSGGYFILNSLQKYRLLIFLGCLLFSPFNSSAQYRFDSWTTDNGLPQASINSAVQTRDGFLWFTTFGGLVRYDGLRFQVFNTGNTKGLKTGRFGSLFEANDGDLWMTTEGQGVTRYRNGQFTTYTDGNGLPAGTTNRLDKDAQGNILLDTGDQILTWNGEKFTSNAGDSELPTQNILQRTRDGAIWYLENSHLRKFENGRATVDFTPDFKVLRVFEDSQKRLWIAADKNELYMLQDRQLNTYKKKDGYPEYRFICAIEDRQGEIFFGTPGGLVRFKDGKFTTYTTNDGLIDNRVSAVYEDREGTVWVGTAGGLSRLTTRTFTTYSAENGLAADNVYPIYQDHQGRIWIGSWSGLTVYENGILQNVGERFGVDKENVTSLFEDREGNFWIGAWNGSVRRIKDGQMKIFTAPEISNSSIRVIYQARDGNMWFGTANGLVELKKDNSISSFTKKEGLPGKEVFALHEDESGRLWIGSDQGLTSFKDGVFTPVNGTDELAGSIVRSIYEDAAQTLWLGTYDSGLYRLKDNRLTHYTTREGLFDNGAFQIIEDEQGNFWISCNLGIYRLKKFELNEFADGRVQSVTSIPYNKRDGMLNSECNGGSQPAGIRAADGTIWFPTQKGVAVINPKTIPLNAQPPPVIIESLIVDTNPVDVNNPVKIQPGQTNLEIHYSGLSFINPELVKFKYKLDGLDTDWIDAATRRTAYYSHLPPGTYRFIVSAANRDNIWNEQGASIEIVVQPSYWQTWWFWIVVALVAGIIAFAFYRRRIGRLQQAQFLQETFARQLIDSQESERKRIAVELHDSLGQSLVLIKNWALLGLKASDHRNASKTNLHEISEMASEAINEVREIAYDLGPFQLERLGLENSIQEMIEKVARLSPIRFEVEIDNLQSCFTKPEELNIFRIVQEGVSNIIKHSNASQAKLSIKRLATSQAKIIIRDDGKGFLPGNSSGNQQRGVGLLGMSERVHLLKGEYSIDSGSGQGTAITITLPCRNDCHEQ